MEQNVYTAEDLIKLVASVTPLTPKAYPALAQLSGTPREAFIIGHSLRHLSSTIGKMQKAIEHAEHTDSLQKALLKMEVFSTGFTVCKLCEVLGISGNELMEGVAYLAKEHAKENKIMNE